MGFFDFLRPPPVAASTGILTNQFCGEFFAPAGPPVDSLPDQEGRRPTAMPWQVRAWQLWHCVGELHEPTSYIARVVSRRIAWRAVEPELDDEQTAKLLQDALGTAHVEELVRLACLNLQVAGDFWLIQTDEGWEILSVVDRNLAKRVEKARTSGREARRFYDPDPIDLTLADSGTRAVLDSAEELLVLSALSRAQSRSRIAQAGILMVPNEISFEGGDPFGADLARVMTTAIKDVSSAAAVAPIKVEMKSDLIEKVRHLTFDRPFDEQVPGKMENAIRRIALGLSVPPELLLGVASQSSHWGAWAVQDETYKSTIAPLAETVAGVLAFIVNTMTGQDVVLEPDATELLARRAGIDDAIAAARVGAVSLEYVRRALGAADTDMPTERDLAIIAVSPVNSQSRSALGQAPAGGQPAGPVGGTR